MKSNDQFALYDDVDHLPKDWEDSIGVHNRMLSTRYLQVLESYAPENMKCAYVGIYVDDQLVGGALLQYIFLRGKASFEEALRKVGFLKKSIFRLLSSSVLIVGNNMLSGHNGFYIDASRVSLEYAVSAIEGAVASFKKKYASAMLIVYKDHNADGCKQLKSLSSLKSYATFTAQPNMIMNLSPDWATYLDYENALSKKYRARSRTARKKRQGLFSKELSLKEIQETQGRIYNLYMAVVRNAPFNTFLIPPNHMEGLKRKLGDRFHLFGYFNEQNLLVAFYTLIQNNNGQLESYFLGYDQAMQKERQLYLNMLFDMIKFGVEQRFRRIILGRTALEIKSTVGAEPYEIYGLVRHKYLIVNILMSWFLSSIRSREKWTQRHPFN